MAIIVTVDLVPAGSGSKGQPGQEWQPHVRPGTAVTLRNPVGWKVATRQWRMARLPGRCVFTIMDAIMETAVTTPLTSKWGTVDPSMCTILVVHLPAISATVEVTNHMVQGIR